MRCAERAGTTMMLWQHEFYMVIEPDPHKPSGAPMPYVYQALEFNLGPNLDPEDVEWAGAKQKKGVWVRGVAYAPALHVRKLNREKMREGYLFHTEWNDGDADTALFGDCQLHGVEANVGGHGIATTSCPPERCESARNPCCGPSITFCLWRFSRGECHKRIIYV